MVREKTPASDFVLDIDGPKGNAFYLMKLAKDLQHYKGEKVSAIMAEMMGGDVVVTSEEGKGSVFTLSVPRECPEYNEDDVDSNVINLDSDDNLVVLVDDDVAMHDLIKRTISKLNLTLIGATNSEKGMELIREVKPKLILLDVLMPGRDGWSLLKECKTDLELKDIPVIMICLLYTSPSPRDS